MIHHTSQGQKRRGRCRWTHTLLTRLAGCALAAGACTLAAGPDEKAWAQSAGTGLRFIQEHDPVPFREGHELPPLIHWRALAFDVQKELADNWGYALYTYARSSTIDQVDDPESDFGKVVRLAASDPDRYPLSVQIAPGNDLNNQRIRYDQFPEEAFARTADGQRVDDAYHFSPLANEQALTTITDYLVEQIDRIQQHATIDYFINGGEYLLRAPRHTPVEALLQDPDIRQAWQEDGRHWIDFASDHKARHERFIRDKIYEASPQAAYFHYSEVGSGNVARGMKDDWPSYDFLYRDGISDLASPRHYWHHGNSGATGPHDILSQVTNSRAQEIDAGATFGYYWVSAGWTSRVERGGSSYADQEIYEGYLKSLYSTGVLGAIAGYFGNRPYSDPVEESLPQFLALGRVHALFSHADELLMNSRLLPGPDMHRWSRDLPAYEFPTGHQDKRVIVRKHNERDQWLVCAWAADGEPAMVEVDVPDLGVIQIHARPGGHVRIFELEDAQPVSHALLGVSEDASLDDLADALDNGHAFQRRDAIHRLARMNDERARDVLTQAIDHHDTVVRRNAMRGLRTMQNDAALEHLEPALNDQHVDVRWTALRLIADLADEHDQARTILQTVSSNTTDPDKRRFAIQKLRPIGYEPTPSNAKDRLKPENQSPRQYRTIDLPADDWRFQRDPDHHGHERQWYDPSLDDADWETIGIEDWWQGFGHDYVGVAWYRREIDLDANPQPAAVNLHFGAVDESAWVWVNGQFVGGQNIGGSGWDVPFRVDVTDAIEWGQTNQITVRVMNRRAGGGIWRPMTLELLR